MNAQKQRKNASTAVSLIILVLLVILGIGLYFLFTKHPSAAPEATPAPVATEAPAPTPVPTAAPAATPKILGIHTVIPRDTLWWISDKWYKDPVLWPSIYEINRAAIKDPDLIFPGQKFDIPALAGSTANLSPEDKTLLSQGYLEAYRVYKEKGKKDAGDYKVVGDKLAPKP